MFISRLFSRRTADSEPQIATDTEDEMDTSCPTDSPTDVSKRAAFARTGCMIYGYPSHGGCLMKAADLADMQFLNLDRFKDSARSSDEGEEDRFCAQMRKLGATWWKSEREYMGVLLGERSQTAREKMVLVFGWPSEGKGVWMLKYGSAREQPDEFGKLRFMMTMDERIRVMQELGAGFIENADNVEYFKESHDKQDQDDD